MLDIAFKIRGLLHFLNKGKSRMRSARPHLRSLAAALTLASLGGCATGPLADPRDPFEPVNRAVFVFNGALDHAAIKPAARVYARVVPEPARVGVSNFFANIGDAWSAVNNALQGKGRQASDSFARLLLNSTFGLLGVFDLASKAGIERHKQDFGQTLGHWGVGPGPYLVLPVLGPSTLRDTAGLPLDFKGDLVSRASAIRARNTAEGLRMVDLRDSWMGVSRLLEGAALDKYVFVRDAHMQRRNNSIAIGLEPDAPAIKIRAEAPPEALPEALTEPLMQGKLQPPAQLEPPVEAVVGR